MHVHPDIAALRSDRAPQRHAQSAMQAANEAWRAEPGGAALIADLARFGTGAPLESCPQLEAVVTGQGEAERLIGLLSRHYCAALAAHPWGHPPFRNGFDGRSGSLLLARAGRAQLMLHTREPGDYANPSHVFSDEVRHDAVLAGRAEARIVHRTRSADGAASLFAEPIALASGVRLGFDLAHSMLAIERVTRRLVILRLQRGGPDPQPSREYDAQTGELVQQCAGSLATSRTEAIVALLGRMQRSDAAPAMGRLALGEADMSLRWQAVRECLALDSALGFRALCALARRSDDPLAAPAGALRAQLLETWPQLAAVETSPCPA